MAVTYGLMARGFAGKNGYAIGSTSLLVAGGVFGAGSALGFIGRSAEEMIAQAGLGALAEDQGNGNMGLPAAENSLRVSTEEYISIRSWEPVFGWILTGLSGALTLTTATIAIIDPSFAEQGEWVMILGGAALTGGSLAMTLALSHARDPEVDTVNDILDFASSGDSWDPPPVEVKVGLFPLRDGAGVAVLGQF